MTIYQQILSSTKDNYKLLAVLIDPDKIHWEDIKPRVNRINASMATHIFVGGSTVEEYKTHLIVEAIKNQTHLPVIIFPGDVNQITEEADALLFLSLISGRNPDYLIGKHIEAVPLLRRINLEVIPTSYILVGSKNNSAVERVTKSCPIPLTDPELIRDTAVAGELQGHKLIYIEAGSGALHAVNEKVIRLVKSATSVPIIIGGGIRDASGVEKAYKSGADMVVVGTAFESDINFLDSLSIGRVAENAQK